MEDRIILSIMFFIIFFVVGGLNIFFPELMYKMSASNTRNKKPTKAILIRFRSGGIFLIICGVLFMFAVWTGKLNGV